MAVHVAILKRPYVRLILDGRKTVESRLTRTAQPPFGSIRRGERIFIKASAGPFMGTALAGRVDQYDGLSPADVVRLRREYGRAVHGDEAYWTMKKDSRFAVFVALAEVEPIDVGPAYPKSMRAWHVLDEKLSPMMDVQLTAGAIRNRYLAMPGASQAMRGRGLTLLMPDGREVCTEFADGKPMLRWRGIGAYYQTYAVKPGDLVRVVALGSGRYRVNFRHA